MSWIGDILEGLSRAYERLAVRDERDRIRAARARAVARVAAAEAELSRAREAAARAAEADDLYDAAEAEATEGREP